MYFSIDLTTIAAGRQIVNLALYFNGQFMEYGVCFAEACCVYIIKKLIKFNRVVLGQNKSTRVDSFREQRNALIKECVKLVGEEY